LHGFLWENGGPMVDVNLLVSPNSVINVIYPWQINDRGEIAAQGILQNGDVHAVLLIPDGDCDNDTEAKIATSQNNAAPVVYPSTIEQGNESLGGLGDRLRGRFGQLTHTPAPAPRD
jgi:hypothetical protein